jgi:hypothetical protein
MPGWFIAIPLVVLLSTASTTPAVGDPEARPEPAETSVRLVGRHAITVHAGLLSSATVETDTSPGRTNTETRVSGFLGSVSYDYWTGQDWRVGVDAGVLDVETSSSVEIGEVTSETAVVVPVLFTTAYYPSALAMGRSARPFASVAVGPYVGTATNSRTGTTVATTTVTETVIGARAQVGLDVFFAGRFKTGISVGYHFVSDFEQSIGDDSNYSGPEFSVGIGILWGGAG